MKAFFKDSDKIIINSMDYTEALVGKQFLENLSAEGKTIKVEQRYDVNDDFDGLVISIVDAPVPEEPESNTTPDEEPQEDNTVEDQTQEDTSN